MNALCVLLRPLLATAIPLALEVRLELLALEVGLLP